MLSARVSTRSRRWSEPGHDLVRPGHGRANRLRPVVTRPATVATGHGHGRATGQGNDPTMAYRPFGHGRASCLQPVVARPDTVSTQTRSFLRCRPGRRPARARPWPRARSFGHGRAGYLRPVVARCYGLMLVRPAVALARPRPHARPSGHGRVSCLWPVVTQPATALTWPGRLREPGHGLVLPSTVMDVNSGRKVSNWRGVATCILGGRFVVREVDEM